jgi:PPOX class probable F420-dependent enzyme
MELDQDTVRLAQGKNLATIVTLMPDGQPQAQLRWIDSDGDALLVNTEPQRQAARNLARDPRVTVLIHSCEDPYDWAEVRGEVEKTINGDEARSHIDRLAQKYTSADYQMPIGPQGRVLLRIRPKKVVTPRRLGRS